VTHWIINRQHEDGLEVIELRHLRTFVALCEELHFGHAAKRLSVAQPAVSRDIGAIERALGLKLFKRSTRHVELTDSGRHFYARLAEPFGRVERAIQQARQEAKGAAGSLRISYMDFALYGPMFEIVRQYHEASSQVAVELVDTHTDMQIEWLLEERVDAGFLIGPISHPELSGFEIGAEPLVVVFPANHPLARQEPVSIASLSKEPFVLGGSQSWSGFRRLVQRTCAQYGFAPTVVQEATTTDAIFGLVRVGMGLTFYVDSRRRFEPGLVFRSLAEPSHTVQTTLAWNPKNKSATLPKFLKLARTLCGGTAPSLPTGG